MKDIIGYRPEGRKPEMKDDIKPYLDAVKRTESKTYHGKEKEHVLQHKATGRYYQKGPIYSPGLTLDIYKACVVQGSWEQAWDSKYRRVAPPAHYTALKSLSGQSIIGGGLHQQGADLYVKRFGYYGKPNTREAIRFMHGLRCLPWAEHHGYIVKVPRSEPGPELEYKIELKIGDSFTIHGEMYILAQCGTKPGIGPRLGAYSLINIRSGNSWGGYVEAMNIDHLKLHHFQELLKSEKDKWQDIYATRKPCEYYKY